MISFGEHVGVHTVRTHPEPITPLLLGCLALGFALVPFASDCCPSANRVMTTIY
jgi:hypothetical protein